MTRSVSTILVTRLDQVMTVTLTRLEKILGYCDSTLTRRTCGSDSTLTWQKWLGHITAFQTWKACDSTIRTRPHHCRFLSNVLYHFTAH